MSMKTVENLLEISIDYVAMVNMESFVDIVFYLNNGTGSKMNGVYYYILNEDELKDIRGSLKQHM